MPSTVLVNYSLDLTGLSPDNKIVGEQHSVTSMSRAFSLNYGPFFDQSLVVRNSSDNSILTPNEDYVVAVLYTDATLASGKAVYCFIVINNLALTSVHVTYQTIGGEYARYTTAIQELLSQVALDNRPVEWGSLLGLPSGFTPTPHMHTLNDIYNYGALYDKLEQIRQAILTGDQAAMNELRQWVTNQMNSAAGIIATEAEVFDGTDPTKRVVPKTLKALLDARFANIVVPGFDFEVEAMDDDWGYWRHKESKFTICWGVTPNVAPNTAYRAYFRRRFNVKPVLTGSSSFVTTDATPTGNQWAEVVGVVVDHTVNPDSFYVTANRISGSGADGMRFRYIAVGYSDDAQPLATSSGLVSTVPPTGGTVEQPSWSGTNNLTLTTSTTDATQYRMGVLFPSSVVGGGYTFNTTNQSQVAQFFYTLYPGLFNDADYEIKGSVTGTTFDPNVTYTGIALDTWVDLTTIKAIDPSGLNAGFTWTTSGLYGGNITLSITIRKKSNTSITATRVFTLYRTSTVVAPKFYGLGATSITRDAKSTSKVAGTKTYYIKNETSVDYSGTGDYGIVIAGTDDSTQAVDAYGPSSNADKANWEVRLTGILPANGFSQGSTSAPINNSLANTTGWITMTSWLAMANGWNVDTSDTTTSVYASSALRYEIRHKTDKQKLAYIDINLIRVANDIIPVFSGTTALSTSVPAGGGGGMVTAEIGFSANSKNFVQKINANYAGNDHILQNLNVFDFGDNALPASSAAVGVQVISNTGSQLTVSSGGMAVSSSGIYPLSADRKLIMSGLVTVATVITLRVHIAYNNASYENPGSYQNFTFTINPA